MCYAQFNERKKEQQVERRHRVSADLRGYLIQTEGPTQAELPEPWWRLRMDLSRQRYLEPGSKRDAGA